MIYQIIFLIFVLLLHFKSFSQYGLQDRRCSTTLYSLLKCSKSGYGNSSNKQVDLQDSGITYHDIKLKAYDEESSGIFERFKQKCEEGDDLKVRVDLGYSEINGDREIVIERICLD